MNNDNNTFKPREDVIYVFKIYFIFYIFFILIFLILVRLFYLQIIEGNKYEMMALNNRQQIVQIPSSRGKIFSNDEKTLLARNKKSFSIYFDPRMFPYGDKKKMKEIVDRTVDYFGIDKKYLIKMINKKKRYQYKSFLLLPNVPFEKIIHLAEHYENFLGLSYESTPLREYPEKKLYGHITGYISRISPKQYKEKKKYGYNGESYIGAMGVEGFYDLEIRGRDGKKIKVIDSKNRVVKEYFTVDGKGISGGDAILTIDHRIQNILKRVMDGYLGAAIATKASTGEILGMYSYPTFDPNIFISPSEYKDEILSNQKDTEHPYFNRAIQGLYAPSSTFKIIVASAALKNGIDFYKDYNQCNGSVVIGNRKFRGPGTTKRVNMYHAISYSCNIFFYLTGIKIGSTAISNMAFEYNLGSKTGIDLLYEKIGQVPTKKWKNDKYGIFWWDGDTANLSIGQGYLLTTPIQMNTVIAAVANNGIAYRPHLLKKIVSGDIKKTLYESKKELIVNLLLDNNDIKRIQSALRGVATIGSARNAAQSPLKIYGKTGTAQNVGENHSWFVGYVDYKGEKLALTVFIKNGYGGSLIAAPFSTAIAESIVLNRDPHQVYMRLMKNHRRHDIYNTWLKRKGYSND